MMKLRILFFIFLVSFFIFYLVGLNRAEKLIPSGDEPHYLIITKSIAEDGDFDLKNNYTQNQFNEFGHATIDYHLSPNLKDQNKFYSVHNIGLPILLVPGYILGGIKGAIVCINIIAALSALLIFIIAYEITKNKISATIIWLVSFIIPISLYSAAIFTEMPLFLLSLLLIYILLQYSKQPKRYLILLFSIICALLLWLHVKYAVTAFVFLISMIVLFKNYRLKNILILLIFPLLSYVLLILLFGRWYGLYSLTAQYPLGLFTSTDTISPISIFKGIFGILIDKAFGVLVFAPVYIFSFSGLYFLFKDNKKIAIGSIIVFLVTIFSFGMNIKYLGWCPVGRFAIPILSILTLWLIYSYKYLKSIYLKIIYYVLLLYSITLSIILIKNYDLSYSVGFENKMFTSSNILKYYNKLYPVLIGKIETYEFPAIGTNGLIKLFFWILLIIVFSYIIIKNSNRK